MHRAIVLCPICKVPKRANMFRPPFRFLFIPNGSIVNGEHYVSYKSQLGIGAMMPAQHGPRKCHQRCAISIVCHQRCWPRVPFNHSFGPPRCCLVFITCFLLFAGVFPAMFYRVRESATIATYLHTPFAAPPGKYVARYAACVWTARAPYSSLHRVLPAVLLFS